MSCGKKDDFKHNNCVCEVVRAIKDIQENAEEVCECPSNCFLEPLGAISPSSKGRPMRADTRVIVLSTADGTPFHAFFTGNRNRNGRDGRDGKDNKDNACVSIFFRVEDVFDNCCAVLRVLEPIKMENRGDRDQQGQNQMQNVKTVNLVKDCCIDLSKVCDVDNFRSTNDCITVDLKCFCAVQCIADVDLRVCQ
ncbi:CotY/CotZ family spore coat protein [Bacillus sp. DTU_2020_1000418_1_SI_GHA_SEK_038]|uniref:CotY/CotZ family spore coat protein n=1 Tax=Bacillus sp. DTU_2020_1000418_1_SI_GHA_SEK_038 TaxID=3077585 RepID=UPI0028F0B8C2|nr:CotY/CotZ family spore coat protein [Bacillus sp. DTU_2020_1000418_1_SI_GHA_SEK_038]WNS76890.1 CotY/CotZ family spore coat protein [Bacillus sp. DTU_2020_1000418_1_SI_GHA_SEK_038]